MQLDDVIGSLVSVLRSGYVLLGDEQGGTGTNFSDFTVKGNPAKDCRSSPTPTCQRKGLGPEDVVWVVNTEALSAVGTEPGSTLAKRFRQTLGNQFTTKLVSYSYFAFATAGQISSGRLPIGGNARCRVRVGQPTFWDWRQRSPRPGLTDTPERGPRVGLSGYPGCAVGGPAPYKPAPPRRQTTRPRVGAEI